MLDCGFGPRELSRRFARLEMSPDQLAGIVVTHEHSDHLGGVFQVARQYKVPVWLTHGCFESASKDEALGVDVHICRDGEAFDVGDLEIRPYTVPHDAREPVQYTASDGRYKLGVLTDVGHGLNRESLARMAIFRTSRRQVSCAKSTRPSSTP